VSHQTSRDPFVVPLERWGVRMRNRKLRNIRPSGTFSPEVTSSNVRDPFGIPLEWWGARMRNRNLRHIRLNVTRRASSGKYGSATGSAPGGAL
jgi:hypothetical protein